MATLDSETQLCKSTISRRENVLAGEKGSLSQWVHTQAVPSRLLICVITDVLILSNYSNDPRDK